jgi:hypothetical protein
VQSIHVSASALQRVARVVGWMMPPISVVISVLALGYRWVGDRASIEDVGDRIGPVRQAAREAQAEAFHCSSVLKEHTRDINRAWAEIVMLHAELEVYRRYGNKDPKRRGELIEDGIRFFRAEYDRQLEAHPNEPAEAARRALLARWRPEP